MNDEAPKLPGFNLDFDINVGGKVVHPAGTRITVRKPGSGEMRGLSLMAISQLDYSSLETLLPRITHPLLNKFDVAAMDPADLMQAGNEVMDFLLPKAVKATFQQA